jgi:Coenzyme PQQ synthesis protein D (PqqD)
MDRRVHADELLASRLRVPAHVVYRAFPGDTVILNLETGTYHGLNETGGQMLEVLERSDSVGAALIELIDRYDVAPAELERDLRGLCADLLERDLVELQRVVP